MNPELLAWLAECNKDPLAFVLGAFPWSEPGTTLEAFSGPEDWQRDILLALGQGLLTPNQAIQLARASGHGIGKSACVSWIIIWAFTTAPDTRGVVTANTENQLKTKTWAELGKWFNLFIGREHFTLTATALLSKDPSRERTWRIDMVPWSEKNTEAFQGLHNKGKRLLLIMDEASAIPDQIWEVAEGAMTDSDTEIIWCAFGNPTRNIGRFKECFGTGRFAKFWNSASVDSRAVSITNKTRIGQWAETYGDDSDFFRIRVKGEFPRQGEMEFFSAEDIAQATVRDVSVSLGDPLALGVDVARYGKNASVLYPRKGRDARNLPRQRYQGLSTVQLAEKVFEVHTLLRPDGIMIDGGGVGGGVVDNVRQKQLFCYEVQFGAKDDTPHAVWGSQGEKYANKRSGMYGAARAWLKTGAIPPDPDLIKQFQGIKYVLNKKDEIQLISKEDLVKDNPDLAEVGLDDIDAFVLTFAHALEAHARAGGEHPQRPLVESEYNPFSAERMVA